MQNVSENYFLLFKTNFGFFRIDLGGGHGTTSQKNKIFKPGSISIFDRFPKLNKNKLRQNLKMRKNICRAFHALFEKK